MRPVILYELNEVPWRVFDRFVERNPGSQIARLIRDGRSFTTVSSDAGELHPWSTWPSLHRGVPNTKHEITFINQEITTPYKPIWELLRERGVKIGVFGSLQSYQRFPSDLENVAFFVPDTFSPSARTFPKRYEAFQELNLVMTERDGAQAKAGVPISGKILTTLAKMTLSGMRARTGVALARQLRNERTIGAYRTRRSILQAPVAFDFFLDALRRTKPEFSTFFTNHVAGMMHRYWNYAFPEDFDAAPESDPVRSTNIDAAMRIADEQLRELVPIVESRGGLLVVATSMGQEAVHRGTYLGELRLERPTDFLRAIGFDEPVHDRLAMQPDFAFETQSPEAADKLAALAGTVRDSNRVPTFGIKKSGTTVNLNLRPTGAALGENRLFVGDSAFPLGALGMVRLERDQGTGYHQPRGCLVVLGAGVRGNEGRPEIPLEAVAPSILDMFDAPRPDYMIAPVALRDATFGHP